jgi:nitrite reductase/ring-hydroxylating ferredoxin subunit
MSDTENTPAMHRRQLLQAGTAGLAATLAPGCLVGEMGSPAVVGSGGGSASPDPSEAGTLDASSTPSPSPDVYVSDPFPPSPDPDSGLPNQGDLPDTSADPMEAGEPAEPMDSGPVEAGPPAPTAGCYQNANTFVLSLAQHPELSNTGGTAIFNDGRYSDPICHIDGFYVVKTKPGQYAAFSTGCTHACCQIQINGNSVSCPCHGSRFNLTTGQVTGGPARSSLPSLPTSTDGSNVCVQLM